MPVSSALTWLMTLHFLMTLKYLIFTSGFFPVFGTELLKVASNVLKDPTDYHASCNICVKLLISEGLCTSH